MQHNSDLQQELQLITHSASSPTTPTIQSRTHSESVEAPAFESENWTTTFNTSLLTTRASNLADSSQTISELMKSPEFEAIVFASKYLANKENISPELATERVIETFRKLDRSWKQIIISRGLNALIDR